MWDLVIVTTVVHVASPIKNHIFNCSTVCPLFHCYLSTSKAFASTFAFISLSAGYVIWMGAEYTFLAQVARELQQYQSAEIVYCSVQAKCCSKMAFCSVVVLKGPWTPKLTYHFSKRAQSSENFDSNIGIQRFVNTEKFAFGIGDLRKWRRKHVAMMVPSDVTTH